MDEKELIEEELRRTKEDLEDLEKHIEMFSAFLPLAVCTVNPIRIIIDVNQALQNLVQYSAVEIIGKPLESLFVEEGAIKFLANKAQEIAGPAEKELTLVRKDKSKVPVSISISVRKDNKGDFIGFFLAISDITSAKKSREELEERVRERTRELEDSRKALMNMLEDVEEAREKAEEEKSKTNTIIINLTDGLLFFDSANKLVVINPKAEEFFKVKAGEVIEKSTSDLASCPEFKLLFDLTGKEIKKVFRKELRVGRGFVLEVSTNFMMKGRERLGTIVILHDISREKMIERMKTEFVSLSAHQLRTPLSAIKWTLRMLLDGDLGEITPEQREFLGKTYQSNERMISLINDLLNVTRIEEGRYLYKPALASLEEVTRSVVDSYEGEIKKRGLELKIKKPIKELPRVKIDVEKMKLAIQNLLDNAVKYTKAGGKVTISLKRAKKEVEFQIQDTGVGISQEQQKRIFTKFFRGANVMRMETEGSGLGLFIAKNIIEAHNGKIWFESEEGKGAAFFFSLPVEKEFEEFIKEF